MNELKCVPAAQQVIRARRLDSFALINPSKDEVECLSLGAAQFER
jgi:hypothetical protein